MILPLLLQLSDVSLPDSITRRDWLESYGPILESEVSTALVVNLPALTPVPIAPLPASTQTAGNNPSPSGRFVAFGPVSQPQGREVRRAPDGLFYITAIVNGAPLRFIVDTGATMVVLTPEDARRAGIMLGREHYKSTAETANGRTSMARVTLDDVVVGDVHTQGVDAAVVGENLSVSLLGQNWLSRLNSLTIAGDRLSFN